MVRTHFVFALLAAGLVAPRVASAQMVTVGTPFRSAGESFFERFGAGWSVRSPGFSASFGGGNGAAPPFGGYTPNAGLQGGFSFGGGPFSGGLNFTAAHGASRSLTSTTPMVTTLNGYPGFLIDSVQRPFVTGLVPVVGPGVVAYAPVVTGLPVQPQLSPLANESLLPWQEKLASQGLRPLGKAHRDDDEPDAKGAANAGGGAEDKGGRDGLIDPLPPTRAERERQKAAEESARNDAARAYYEKGLAAVGKGKPSVAKLYFEMAAKRASGPLKDEIEERMSRR